MNSYTPSKRMHVAVKDCAALSELVSRFEALEECEGQRDGCRYQEKRSSPRYPIMAAGFVQVVKDSGEIMVFPVLVRNISRDGMLLEFKDKGHVSSGMLKLIESLSVTFLVDGETAVTLECLPARILLDDPMGLGVQVSDESSDTPTLQRFLM